MEGCGTVLGNISADQALVMKGGKVNGNVNAREAILGGEVKGSIVVEERVEVQE